MLQIYETCHGLLLFSVCHERLKGTGVTKNVRLSKTCQICTDDKVPGEGGVGH